MTSPLRQARAWHCAVAMPHPVRLGDMVYRTRDFVALELETRDGRVGSAIGYTRGTPLLEATERMVAALDPALVGDPEAATDDLAARFAPGWGALIRGASLVDIALWDLAAQAAGRDVGRSLGGSEAPVVPWMFVAGYFAAERPITELVSEAERAVSEGAVVVKVMLRVDDPTADRELVAALRQRLGPEQDLAIDFHGALRDPDAAADLIRSLDDFGLMFAEDPFRGHDLHRLGLLADQIEVPIAVGEDLIEESLLEGLLDVAGYVRVDATASGGLSFARRAVVRAAAAGRGVLPHVFEPIHRPLAALGPAVVALERIPAFVGADPWDQLVDPGTAGPSLLSFDRAKLTRTATDSWHRGAA